MPVLKNVRYASDSDHSRYESELTLWAKSGHFAPQQKRRLFDHLIGAGQQRLRQVEAKRLRSLHVDDEIELGRLLDRDVSWLCPTQNLVNKLSGASKLVSLVRSVRNQTSRFNKLAKHVQGRQSYTDGKRVDLDAVRADERVHDDIERVRTAP